MIKTKIFIMSNDNPDRKGLKECAEILKAGGLVAFPTETVYGLGANAFDDKACRRIFEVKRRPADKPLLCHLSSLEQAEEIAYLNDYARDLIKRYTPGPLTLVMKKKDNIPFSVCAGGDTVGLRFPDNNICRELIDACGFPIAAPSANISDMPAPTSALPVKESFCGKIEAVIDGGETEVQISSTVISLAGDKPVLLRRGALSDEDLKEIMGK